MHHTRLFMIAVVLVSSQLVSGQDLSRYRAYALDSSLDSVLLASASRATNAKVLHERPALIQDSASSARARAAIREATRLEIAEAPRRELEQRKREAADATAARDKIRATNKAAFRP